MGLYYFICSCHPSLDVPCDHVLGFLQRLPGGRNGIDAVALFHNLISSHRSAHYLLAQYKHATYTGIDYSNLVSDRVIPASIHVRPGRPRTVQVEKRMSSGFVFGHCGKEGHNKLTCPTLKMRCSICKQKGHTRLTCRTPLNAFLLQLERQRKKMLCRGRALQIRQSNTASEFLSRSPCTAQFTTGSSR